MSPPISINISAGRLRLRLLNPLHPAFFAAPAFSLLEQGLNYARGHHSSCALHKQPIPQQISVLAIGWYEVQCWWDLWLSWRSQRERARAPAGTPQPVATPLGTSEPVVTPTEAQSVFPTTELQAPMPGLDNESLIDFDIKMELEAAL